MLAEQGNPTLSRGDYWIEFRQIVQARGEDVPESEQCDLFDLWCDHRLTEIKAHNARVQVKINRLLEQCDLLHSHMGRFDPHEQEEARSLLWKIGTQIGAMEAPPASHRDVAGVSWE